MMSRNWSDSEVALIVHDYFAMLKDELSGKSRSKNMHKNALMPFLDNRSAASVEYKHRNIRAVLVVLGMLYISGYKPLYNFQKSLFDEVQSYISSKTEIENLFDNFVNDVPETEDIIDFHNWKVSPPEISTVSKPKIPQSRGVQINYLEKEQQNINLGLRGEELALAYERLI